MKAGKKVLLQYTHSHWHYHTHTTGHRAWLTA